MSRNKSAAAKPAVMSGGKPLGRRIKDNWQLYLMLLVPVVLTIIYKYIPMYGIQIAFRDYKASKGFMGSEWVGLEWFLRFFSAPTFWQMMKIRDYIADELLAPQAAYDLFSEMKKRLLH